MDGGMNDPRSAGNSEGAILVRGARTHNLRGVDVDVPLDSIVVLTGVSGSGKSTLVDDTLRRALMRKFYGSKERPGAHKEIKNYEGLEKIVVIDQTAIGRTPRSNPATYTGMFNAIRDLFAKLPTAKVRGYESGRFSFNVKGGRCEKCQGDGLIKIEMNFLPPVYVTCENCNGKRYNRETLEIAYKGLNISDVLNLTVDEAVSFFRAVPQIYDPCLTLAEVGLGYIHLGQSGTTLSGGEAQRIKLAAEIVIAGRSVERGKELRFTRGSGLEGRWREAFVAGVSDDKRDPRVGLRHRCLEKRQTGRANECSNCFAHRLTSLLVNPMLQLIAS